MSFTDRMEQMTRKAREASGFLSVLEEEKKNELLRLMAGHIRRGKGDIRAANRIDLEKAAEKGLSGAFIDRLELTDERIENMASMLEDVAALGDPVGAILEERERPNGLVIRKVRVPIGVIGIIYESRPNVTADCAGLCLKSGNSVILRGGSDALRSNKAIADAMSAAVTAKGYPELFFFLDEASREAVDAMLKATGGIDLIMPRGGESLIKMVTERSRVPVIKHYKGICHVYVDAEADMDMALKVCHNAKVQRPGVCNAMETMLVHEKIAASFLPRVAESLLGAGVTLKGCERTQGILGAGVTAATEEDYATEWLALTLNIRVVEGISEAIGHIARYGSGHSDAIITGDADTAAVFTRKVDSAAVYVNASTRFTDGGEFGKGAEIGISTDKLHARGPMGLEELTTYKYIVLGTGQVRE